MLKYIKSYGLVALGCCLTAAAYGLIVLPQSFAAGGVTGLAVLLQKLIPVPVSVFVFIISLSLFLLGWFMVGKAFVIKSLLSTLLFPVVLEIMQQLPLLHGLESDSFVSSLIAGAILGIGCGLILLGNGSGGGFDILGVILHKKLGVPVAVVMSACDFLIILTQTAINGVLKTVYGVVVVLVSSFLINKLLVRGEVAGRIYIFSDHREAIQTQLISDVDVGITLLDGEGGYRQTPTKVIMTIVPMNKVEKIKKAVYDIDSSAFVVVDTVQYVSGKGYTIER